MKFKTIKSVVKNGLITAIQSTCSTTHVAIVYAANLVEEVEVASTKRLTGELRFDIIKRRRTESQAIQDRHKAGLKKMKTAIIDAAKSTHKTSMDLMHEFEVFNKVHTETVDFEDLK